MLSHTHTPSKRLNLLPIFLREVLVQPILVVVAVALRVLADVVPLINQRASARGVAQEVHPYEHGLKYHAAPCS